MPKPEWIARQSARPTGWVGHIVARAGFTDVGVAVDPGSGLRLARAHA